MNMNTEQVKMAPSERQPVSVRLLRAGMDMAHAARKWYWRTFKIKTFGVRVLLVRDGKVLLVKHRYGGLWVMPGGGMKRFENPSNAGARECFEEVHATISEWEPEPLGVYRNTACGKDDTVTVMIAKTFDVGTFKASLEIETLGWFYPDQLPDSVSAATVDRIFEYLDGKRNLCGAW
jgi:8-oxo-dGTP pyrophosphatase MutT (NUDIX family)